MDRDLPNPYHDLPLAELHDALAAKSRDLLAGARVSRQDIAHLCIAAGWAIEPHEPAPANRHARIRAGESLAEILGEFYEREANSLRARTLRMATDALGLPRDVAWPDEVASVLHDAYRSDDRMYAALRCLEETRKARRD